jgi:hypothetical protein
MWADMFNRAMAAYEEGQFADAEHLCVTMLEAEPQDFDANQRSCAPAMKTSSGTATSSTQPKC